MATTKQLAALRKARAAKAKKSITKRTSVKSGRLKLKGNLSGSASRADADTLGSALWQLDFCDYDTIGRYCCDVLPSAQLKKVYMAIYRDLYKYEQAEVRQYL